MQGIGFYDIREMHWVMYKLGETKLNTTLFSRRKLVKKMARWIRKQECCSLNVLPLRWYDDDDDNGLHSFPFLGIKQSCREDSTLIVLSQQTCWSSAAIDHQSFSVHHWTSGHSLCLLARKIQVCQPEAMSNAGSLVCEPCWLVRVRELI